MNGGVEVVQRRFATFAATYPELPLYRRICEALAADADRASLLLAAAPGQARPVLLLAALHELVLRRGDEVPAASWFRRAGPDGVDGDPWPDVRATLIDHEDELRATIASRSTQTNEVNRAVYVAALLAALRCDPGEPVVLIELGTSAGLLLGTDRFRITLRSAEGDVVWGDPSSPVECEGELVAGRPRSTIPPVAVRVGLDRAPVSLEDPDEVRWLEACLWPDQPRRLARFRAAVGEMRAQPALVLRGDMVEGLPGAIERALDAAGPDREAAHVVVLGSWAVTYVERGRRALMAQALGMASIGTSRVSWATAEPHGCIPDLPDPAAALTAAVEDRGGLASATVLGLRTWRGGVEGEPRVIGLAHPHGAWLALDATS